MSDKRDASWRNPPIAYVVAEVVISPHYSLQNHLPAIQQELRAPFPRTAEAQALRLEIMGTESMPQPQFDKVWQLYSGDNYLGAYLSPRALALHTTRYKHYEDFAQALGLLLRAVENSGLGAYVERIGLRYVDYLLPSDGHRPEDYLKQELRGLTLEEGRRPENGAWGGTYQMAEGCAINLRVMAPAPAGNLLPPNFNAMPLAKPEVMTRAEQHYLLPGKPFGFADTDCVQNIGKVLESASLLTAFQQLHEYVSSTFRAAISPLAEKEWF